MNHELNPAEVQEIITYTGLDLLMLMPEWSKLPVVHFRRDKDGVVQFITILKDLGVSGCLLYTSPSPRDLSTSRMPSSA